MSKSSPLNQTAPVLFWKCTTKNEKLLLGFICTIWIYFHVFPLRGHQLLHNVPLSPKEMYVNIYSHKFIELLCNLT